MRKRKRFAYLGTSLLLALAVCLCIGVSAFADGAQGGGRAVTEFPLFTVSGRNSSVTANYTYTASEHEDPNLVDGNNNPVKGEGSITGLKVSLAPNETFNYTKVIDLTGKTKDDKLIEFAITPEKIGVPEAEMVEIMLTDAYDPTNVITFNGIHAFDRNGNSQVSGGYGVGLYNGVTYLRAAFTGQEFAARDHFWNAVRHGENRDQGAIMSLDFSGVGGNGQRYSEINSIDKNLMQLYYEDSTKEVYMDYKQRNWSKQNAVCDFDDEELFDVPWEDFTTGECFLSVRARNYEAASFNFVLTALDGQEVSEISTERKIHEISVNTLGYAEDALPNAIAGKTYPVFEASSVSPYYGELDVEAKVYFGTEEDGTAVAVNGGRFAAASAGNYTIVYTSDDGYGKTAKKTLTVTAADSAPEITLTIAGTETSGFVAGDVFALPSAEYSGNIGKTELKKYVAIDGGAAEELGADEYRFPRAGEYVFTYTVTDMVENTESKTVTVNVAAGDKPKFTDAITLPRYFVGGREYTLPAVYARNYTDGSASLVRADTYVTDEFGVKKLYDGKFTPAPDGGDVLVTFEAAIGDGPSASTEFTVPVVNVRNSSGDIEADKLFYAGGGNPQLNVNAQDVSITAHENARVDYVNEVAANGFSFSFGADSRQANFETVTLELTDSADSAVKVRFNYTYNGANTVFRVGENGREYTLTEDIFDTPVTFTYRTSDNSAAFSANTRINVKITETVSGEEFKGFASGKVNVSIILSGVTGSARINVRQISNQRMGDLSLGEYAAPVIFGTVDYGGTAALGDKVTLPRMYVADAIDAGLSLKVSVFDPAGNVIAATDGTLLNSADGDREYEITAAKYGSYRVYYSAQDTSGNNAALSYLVEVVDPIAPEIKLSAAVPASAKTGDTLVLPKATAFDNTDGDVAVKIYVIAPDGQIMSLTDGAIKLSRSGRYKIVYLCTDSAGNLSSAEYTVVAA